MESIPHIATTSPSSPCIGIEVADGGMRMVATLASGGAQHSRRWHRRLNTPPSPDQALAALNELITQVLAEGAENAEHPAALGIAFCGDVDPARGVTLGLPTAEGWVEFPLVNRLADHWQ